MGLKVILYDPKGEVEYLLSDIFEVTGHTLYSIKGEEDEVLKSIKELDSQLFILPSDSKKLWVEALKEKVLFPFFILNNNREGDYLLRCGFSELNLVPIPFNPLDLLNKLTAVDKLELQEESLGELGFANALLKLAHLGSSEALKVFREGKECSVKVSPLSLSCSVAELKEILKGEYELELRGEEGEYVKSFNNLGDFFKELLSEEEEIPTGVIETRELKEEVLEELEEGFLLIYKVLNNGTVRRNFYLLRLQGRGREIILSVGLPELGSLSLLNKGLERFGKEIGDITAVLLPHCSFEDLEVLKRLSLKVQRLNVIGRRRLGNLFRLYGVGNLRFKAIEDIPLLRAGLATGHTLNFIPLSDGLSVAIKVKDKLFTGKLLGSFNTEDTDIRKIFHRILYPSKDVLLMDLRTLLPHFSDSKVFPLLGPVVDNPERVYAELRDYRYTPNLVKMQEAVYLLNLTLDYLSEEERERLLERLGSYVELGDKMVTEIFTEPNLFMAELFNALMESVETPERFFYILKELFNYGIYIPPSEV
ncbi:hypothetical protein [Aquifex sp.]